MTRAYFRANEWFQRHLPQHRAKWQPVLDRGYWWLRGVGRLFGARVGPLTLGSLLPLLILGFAILLPEVRSWIDDNPGVTGYLTAVATVAYLLTTVAILRENQALGRETREQRLGAVKPAILFSIGPDLSRRTDDGKLLFEVIVRNAGVGPALNAFIRWDAHQEGIGEMAQILQPISLGANESTTLEFSVNRSYFHSRMIEHSGIQNPKGDEIPFWTKLGRLQCTYRDVNQFYCYSRVRIDMVEVPAKGQALPRISEHRVEYTDSTV